MRISSSEFNYGALRACDEGAVHVSLGSVSDVPSQRVGMLAAQVLGYQVWR